MIQNQKKLWAWGILVSCPYGEPMDDCPAKELRKLSLEDRFFALENLSESVIDKLIDHHNICLASRESDDINQKDNLDK